MVFKEIKDVHKSKYPDAEFTAKLLETVIKPVGKTDGREQVVFVFEGKDEPQELTLWGLENISETGDISDYQELGSVISSMRKLGYKPLIDVEGKQFKTEPSLIGKVLHMKPLETKVGEKGSKPKRWIIEEIKGTQQTITAPETPKSSGLTPEIKQKWEDFLIENLTEPTNEAGIHRNMVAKITDVAVRTPLAAVRKQALQELVKEGKLNIDDKGRYSVVLR